MAKHVRRLTPQGGQCTDATLRQLPALTILAADELVRRARVGRAEFGRIPLQLLAGAIGHVAEVVRLRQPAGITALSARMARRAGSARSWRIGCVELNETRGGFG